MAEAAETQQAQPPDPKAFFENELPGTYNREVKDLEEHLKKLTKRLEEIRSAEATIRFDLTGEGGGVFSLNLKDGNMAAGEAAGPPILTLTQSIEDWRKMQSGGVGSQFNMFSPAKRKQGEKKRDPRGPRARLSKGRVEKLKTVNGAIRFKITDLPEGGQWGMLMKFGMGEAKPEPDCTISVRYQDSMEIATGKLNPQAAFMSGRIKIEGNMGFAMQLGTFFM